MTTHFGGHDVTKPINLVEIPDPTEGTIEYDAAVQRDESTRSITAMPWLPQLPDTWAQDIYDRIEYHERTIAAPNLLEADYGEGTAQHPDELAIVTTDGEGRYVFSAEHATCPTSVLTGKYRYPDAGTGGLAAVLAEEHGTAVIARGLQTTNVPSVESHPLKDEMIKHLPGSDGFLSVHGKAAGMFTRPTDRAEVHACLGLGIEPSDELRDFAHAIMRAARDDLGLYVVLSNDQECYIQKPRETGLKRLEDGSVKRSQLAGLKSTMTNNVARRYLAEINNPAPSLQVEMTNLLRFTPLDVYPKDQKSRVIGVALGYKLMERIVELTPTAYAPTAAQEVVE